MRYNDRLSEQAKAEFAMHAWLETEKIESALNLHTCDVEKATSELISLIGGFCFTH